MTLTIGGYMSENKRIKSLEGLRFYLVVTVVFSHMGFMRVSNTGNWLMDHFFMNGGYAVSYFFILSGFGSALGYTNLFKKIYKENYLNYIGRRIKKIYLPYVVAMCYILIYQFLNWDKSVAFSIRFFETLFKIALGASMTQAWTWSDYTVIGNTPTWFMSCQMFIYLLSPFFLHFIGKIAVDIKKNMLIIYVCLIAEIIIMHSVYKNETVGLATNILYWTPLVRVFEFIIGMCSAYIYIKLSRKELNKIWLYCIDLAAFTVLVVSYFLTLMIGRDKLFVHEQYVQLIHIITFPCVIMGFGKRQMTRL